MSALAVCHYLASIDKKVRACFFAAGFVEKLNLHEPYPTLNNPFVDKAIDWNKVKANCSNIVCFAGDNDEYVPFEVTKKFSELCGAKEFIVVPGAGHFTEKTGFKEFPLLVETIKKELKI